VPPPAVISRAEELRTVQGLFSGINVPWRLYLAQSICLQISVPEVAEIVSSSQKYNLDPRSRMEATRNFLKVIIRERPDTEVGHMAIERVNKVPTD
jgi:hypothetical protein